MNEDRWYRLVVGWASTLLIAGVLLAIGREVVPEVLAVAQAQGHDRVVVAAALLTGAVAGWLAGVRFLGPIAASPGRQRWEIAGDPSRWQRGAALRAVPLALTAAAAVGIVVALASGERTIRAVGIGAATIGVLMVMVAGAMFWQRRDAAAHPVALVVSVALVLFGAAAWGGVAGASAGVVALAVVIVRGGRWRWCRGGLVPRWNLAAAAARREGVSTAALLMEAPATAASSGQRRSIGWLPARVPARLAVIGLWRTAGRMSATIGLGLVLTALATELFGRFAGVLVVAVLLHLTTSASTRVLQVWWTSESARRTMALPHGHARLALSVPAAAATLLTVSVSGWLLSLSVDEVVMLLSLPLLATWRRVSSAHAADQLTMVSTPMGAVPVQVVTRVIAGTDATVLVLITLTLLNQSGR